jgi:hypothetical protein
MSSESLLELGGAKMTRFRWGVFLAMAGLLGASTVVAQDSGMAGGGAGLAAQDVAQSDEAGRLAEIQANREGTISELTGRWAPVDGASQLEAALRAASARELLLVSQAKSFGEVNRILLGQHAGESFEGFNPNKLGDTNEDYLYTPVTPCRIFDTRNAGGGGAIPAGGTRDFYVYGTTDISGQGGNPSGCSAPKGEPRAVHLNVTVVPVGAQGNIRVYPANVATPTASAVNFKLGTNIANALSVGTYYALGPKEIEVFAGAGAAHVLADVLGYYYNADLTLGSGKTLRGVWAVDYIATAGSQYAFPYASFALRLASTPAAPFANIIDVGGSATANCPGTVTNPAAAAGQLCVYAARATNCTFQCIGNASGTSCNAADPFGFLISLRSSAAGGVVCNGTWAVTAP